MDDKGEDENEEEEEVGEEGVDDEDEGEEGVASRANSSCRAAEREEEADGDDRGSMAMLLYV